MPDPIDDFDKYVTPAVSQKPKRQREFRTDRNNNPIAAAVTTGGKNQFTKALDDVGIEWEHGDTFPGNPKLSTIKIKGDSFEGARAILSNTNALKWYRGSTGKTILPKYNVKSGQDFARLPIEHQNDIINGIYQTEGGHGNLKPSVDDFDKYVSPTGQTAPSPDDEFDKYVSGGVQSAVSPPTQQAYPNTPTKPGTTPQVTSIVKDDAGEDLTPEKVAPIKFKPAYDIDLQKAAGLDPLARASAGIARDLQTKRALPNPHSPDLLGEPVTLKFKRPNDPDEIAQAYFRALGGEPYVRLAEKFKKETGIYPWQPEEEIKPKKTADGYEAQATPTQGNINALNAYALGGLDAWKSATGAEGQARAGIAKDQAAYEKSQQSPLETISIPGTAVSVSIDPTAVRDDIGNIGGRALLGINQIAENAKNLAMYGGPNYDPEFKSSQAIEHARESISEPKTAIGQAIDVPVGILSVIAQTEALGPLGRVAFPAQQALEAAHQGPEAAAKRALLAVPLVATGPIAEAAGINELTATQRQIVTRLLAGYGMAGTTAATGGSPVEVLKSFGMGGAFPIGGKGATEEGQTSPIPKQADVEAVREYGRRIEKVLTDRETKVQPTFLRDDQGNAVARVLNPEEVAQGAKPKIRPVHQSDTQVRDETGRFTEVPAESQPAVSTEPLPAESVAQVSDSMPQKLGVSQSPEDSVNQSQELSTSTSESRKGSLPLSREVPRTNYRVPLSDHAPTMYREASPSKALELLPTSRISTDTPDVYLADNPDLALGQGGNKGVMLEFDASKLQGQVNQKPGWQITYQNGAAEYRATYNKQGEFQDALTSVTLRPDAKMSRVERMQMDRALGEMEQQGWLKTQENGNMVYRKPSTSDGSQTPTVPDALVPEPKSSGSVSPSVREEKPQVSKPAPLTLLEGIDHPNAKFNNPKDRDSVLQEVGEGGTRVKGGAALSRFGISDPFDNSLYFETKRGDVVEIAQGYKSRIEPGSQYAGGTYYGTGGSDPGLITVRHPRIQSSPQVEAQTQNPVNATKDTVAPNVVETKPTQAESAAKEPWQMTSREWHRDVAPGDNSPNQSTIDHAAIVDAAMRAGNPVPREAFNDHPELREKYADRLPGRGQTAEAKGESVDTAAPIVDGAASEGVATGGSAAPSQTDLSKVAVNESPETMQKKADMVNQAKVPAMLYNEGQEILPHRKGLVETKTEVGTWVHDPSKVSAKEIRAKVADGTYHALLGIVEQKGIATDRVVTARAPDGTEIESAATSAANEAAQAKAYQERSPDATIETGTGENIVSERTAQRTPEQLKSDYEAQHGSVDVPDRLLRDSRAAELFDKIDKGTANEAETNEFRNLARRYGVPDEASNNAIEGATSEARPEVPASGDTAKAANDTPEDRSVTSIKNAAVESKREAMDLPGLTPSDHQSWAEAGEKARAQGLDTPDKADAIAEQVLSGTKPVLSAEESAGLRDRIRGIENAYEGLADKIAGETDPENIAAAKVEGDLLREKFQRLTDATKLAGKGIARALAIRRSAVDSDMLLTPLRAENAYRLETGKEPTVEVKQQIAELVKQNKELTRQVAERDERIRNDEVSRATEKIRRDVAREGRTVSRKAKAKTLDDELPDLKKQFAQVWKKIRNQEGINPSVFSRFDPEGELMKIAAKIIRNRVQRNVGIKAAELVDQVHGLLQDVGDFTKRDVREMISGFGRTPKPRSELQVRLDALKSELYKGLSEEDIAAGRRSPRSEGPRQSEIGKLPRQGPTLREGIGKKEGPQLGLRQGPKEREGWRSTEGPRLSEGTSKREGPKITDAPKLGPRDSWPARKKAIEKQIAEIERRIDAQDFSEKAKRPATVYDAEGNRLRAKLEQTRRNFNRLKEKNRETTVADALVRWKRFAVLTYGTTIGKLGSAAAGRMAMTPVYEGAGQIGKHVPGLRGVFADEPSARGFLKGEVAAVKQLWAGDSLRDFLSHMKGGEDLIELIYGKAGGDEFTRSSSGTTYVPRSVDQVLDRPGHYHAAIKTIPKRAAFFRHFERALDAEVRKPNPRDIRNPDVQLAIAGEAKAYEESKRAILQQPNWVSNLFNTVVNTAARSDYKAARAFGKALQFRYPITKVPVNFVGESLTHVFGAPAGIGEVAARGVANRIVRPLLHSEAETRMGEVRRNLEKKLPQAVNDLEPEQRQRIARAIKVGGVGLGFLAWGMMRPDQFGGYYQPGKRDSEDVKFGGMRFMGVNIPRWAGHIPPLEAAQFGATLRRVYDSMREKKATDESVVGATKEAVKGLSEEIPFNNDSLVDVMLGPDSKSRKLIGGELRSMIPGAVQQVAKAQDYPAGTSMTDRLNPFGSKDPIKRKPATVADEVRMGLPFARQHVPEDEDSKAQDTKDAYMKRMRKGDIPPEQELRSEGYSSATITQMKKGAKLTPQQVAFDNAPADKSLDRFERMSEFQRYQVKKMMEHKAFALKERADYLLTNAKPEDKAKRQQELDTLKKRLSDLSITPRDPKDDEETDSNPFKLGSGSFKIPAMR